MYFAIDNRTQTLIGVHASPFVLCDLAWLHDCTDDAEIVVAPIDNLLSINDLSTETLDVFSGGTADRYEALLEVQSLLEWQQPIEVNEFLLNIQCINRPLDNHSYSYQENKTNPIRL